MSNVTFRVYRFDPEIDQAPRFEEYPLRLSPGSSLLDGLLHIQETQDSSLTFRRSCRSAICGSCGIRANSRAVLACHTQIEEAIGENGIIVIEPLLHMRVIKDLVVDMAPFFERVKRAHPWLVPRESSLPLDRENLVYPDKDYQKLHRIDHCILCGLCHSDCRVLNQERDFVGPEGVIKAYRFLLDSRDALGVGRLYQLAALGLRRCQDPSSCSVRCPKDLSLGEEVMKLLQEALEELER